MWPEYSKKRQRFKVSLCTERCHIEEVMFIVTNESGDKVELIYSLGNGDTVSFFNVLRLLVYILAIQGWCTSLWHVSFYLPIRFCYLASHLFWAVCGFR